jgi:hypothetical protein
VTGDALHPIRASVEFMGKCHGLADDRRLSKNPHSQGR